MELLFYVKVFTADPGTEEIFNKAQLIMARYLLEY